MKEYLILREFKDTDFNEIADIIAKEWYEEISTEQAILCSQSELALHLSNSTFKRVVTLKDEVVGVVLARYENKRGDNKWRQLEESIYTESIENNYLDVKTCIELHRDEAALEDEAAENYGIEKIGSIELLLIKDGVKDIKIGSKLVEITTNWLRGQGAKAYRLATDDSCDWEYYEHQNMKRVGEKKVFCLPSFSWEGDYHIYVYQDELK